MQEARREPEQVAATKIQTVLDDKQPRGCISRLRAPGKGVGTW